MRSTKWVSVVAAGALTFGVAACGSNNKSSTSSSSGSSTASSSSGGKTGTVALLLPESKTARYESQDRPHFTQKLQELCSGCKLIYSNADQDASKQQQQAEAALTQGAKVLVLDPVDAASAAAIVTRAAQSNVPVISYDRLITNAKVKYYISYDNATVGKLQGQALVDKLKQDGKKGSIVMINGAPTDSNAALFKKGAHSVLDTSGYKIAKEYDTPDWSPDKAQAEMEQAITALGKNGFVGVYAANDGNAGGVVAAMKSNGVDPTKIPITGQDAELPGIQRILAGQQYMTIYKAIQPEADAAATLAVDLIQGKTPDSTLVNSQMPNGAAGNIPSVIFKPVSVTKANIKDTIIKDKFWTPAQICIGQYAAACKAAGIQ
jgi:D-xylose transport system substrate-binding protein